MFSSSALLLPPHQPQRLPANAEAKFITENNRHHKCISVSSEKKKSLPLLPAARVLVSNNNKQGKALAVAAKHPHLYRISASYVTLNKIY